MRSFSWCTFSPVFSPSTEKQVPEKTPYLTLFARQVFLQNAQKLSETFFISGAIKKDVVKKQVTHSSLHNYYSMTSSHQISPNFTKFYFRLHTHSVGSNEELQLLKQPTHFYNLLHHNAKESSQAKNLFNRIGFLRRQATTIKWRSAQPTSTAFLKTPIEDSIIKCNQP